MLTALNFILSVLGTPTIPNLCLCLPLGCKNVPKQQRTCQICYCLRNESLFSTEGVK